MEQRLLDLEIVDTIREVGGGRASDGFARELLDMFGEQSALMTRELTGAVARGDLKQVRYFAHRLKGSAANIGAAALSDKAATLERWADAGHADVSDLAAVTEELSSLREASLAALASLLC